MLREAAARGGDPVIRRYLEGDIGDRIDIDLAGD
jgi:hypothetical protein